MRASPTRSVRSGSTPRPIARRRRQRARFQPVFGHDPYGLGLDLAQGGIAGAKTYFACESAEVLLGHVHGPIARALGLQDAIQPFDSLVAVAGPDWRSTRWLLDASFELPADPSLSTRVKLYITPASLAATGPGAHRSILRLAAALGLDCTPYEELIAALSPRSDASAMSDRWIDATLQGHRLAVGLHLALLTAPWSRGDERSMKRRPRDGLDQL